MSFLRRTSSLPPSQRTASRFRGTSHQKRNSGTSRISRRLVLPKRIDLWSLTNLQQRLVKTGGRLFKHDREVKMEIPVYSAGNNGVYCVASDSRHRR